jgi:hypothetical protein
LVRRPDRQRVPGILRATEGVALRMTAKCRKDPNHERTVRWCWRPGRLGGGNC